MNFFPESFLQELKDRILIEEIVSSYVPLKRTGGNLVGLCPFHREKTPSFTVSPDKQIFHCFGCSTGGNVFTFVMQIENLDFPDAVRFLAAKAGMQLPKDGFDDEVQKARRKVVLEANLQAARFFHANLSSENGREGLSYLKKRELSDRTIRHFGLGFAPNEWTGLITHLLTLGFTKEELSETGLVVKGKTGDYYDRFRNRVMFPIINIRGEVIAFGGRVMDNSLPKYLNSSETRIFSKGRNLFSLNNAKKEAGDNGIILSEGYMDVIALYQAGFKNSVASLGTALTFEQAKLISRYTKKVFITYDSDAAGKAATQRAIDVLKGEEIDIKVLSLEGGKDPDEYIKTYGAQRFSNLLDGSDNYIDYRIAQAARNYELSDIAQKAKFLSEVVGILSTMTNAIECELYAIKTAGEYQISSDVMLSELKKSKLKQKKKQSSEIKRTEIEKATKNSGVNLKQNKIQESILSLLYSHLTFFDGLNDSLTGEDFDEKYKNIFMQLQSLAQAGDDSDLILLNGTLSSDELSVLTGALSREERFDNPQDAFLNLVDDLKMQRGKEKALNRNTDDMKEMIEWYNQIKNRKI